jgi:hypothetical protein
MYIYCGISAQSKNAARETDVASKRPWNNMFLGNDRETNNWTFFAKQQIPDKRQLNDYNWTNNGETASSGRSVIATGMVWGNQSVAKLLKREPPFRDDLSPEAEE